MPTQSLGKQVDDDRYSRQKVIAAQAGGSTNSEDCFSLVDKCTENLRDMQTGSWSGLRLLRQK